MSVLFFDIGATLADAAVGPDGSLELHPLPRVFEVLDAFATTRKGVISNPGPGEAAKERAAAALRAAFGDRFPDPDLIHWGPKTSRDAFDAAVVSAGVPAGDCVFTGEDPDERGRARESGLRTAPHPVLTRAAVDGRAVLWVRIGLPPGRGPAELDEAVSSAEVVPVHVASAHLVLAMATEQGVAVLESAGFTADRRGPVDETSAFLLRDDRPVPAAPAPAGASAGQRRAAEAELRAAAAFAFAAERLDGSAEPAGRVPPVASLGTAPGGVYLAVGAGAPVERLHLPGTRPGHLERLLPDPALLARPGGAGAPGLLGDGFAALGAPSPQTVAAVRSTVTPEAIRDHVARLSGARPLVDGEPLTVRSRDVSSEQNPLVVDALARRFQDLGLTVRRHSFTWRGRRLFNLEAEHRVAGAQAAVLVTAHLDSTAAEGEFLDGAGRPRPYDPARDPAPGADDDGSGVAAVLATAECLHAVLAAGRVPTGSLRFVLFNAEEQGLVGSKFYARAAAAAGDGIAAVLQMDMIAGFRGGTRTVEIHAGSAVPGPAGAASDALGGVLGTAVAAVEPGLVVQRLTGEDDPAAGRSDHASFHERGWAAVAVSENFFDDTAPATGTRQYHRPGDTLTDRDHSTEYATSIARTVAAAALTLAGL
ncbi:M28 family metallopeptidase [Kitasatospora sp. NPDC088346]|uniref:M28 family metallopeptidase n=1 Tax=Kitasatospora sp. NPDC088346 TaxID=3364073 RepID=UPI0038216C87